MTQALSAQPASILIDDKDHQLRAGLINWKFAGIRKLGTGLSQPVVTFLHIQSRYPDANRQAWTHLRKHYSGHTNSISHSFKNLKTLYGYWLNDLIIGE